MRGARAGELVWGREPLLTGRKPRDVVVVLGNRPQPEMEVLDDRIGIDTGAVMGGALTCLCWSVIRCGSCRRQRRLEVTLAEGCRNAVNSASIALTLFCAARSKGRFPIC